MLTITNKGQTEALTHYNAYELYEEVNGPLTLSLTSFNADNPGHILLEEEAVIEALDGREYRIKQMKENKVSKSVEAVSTFFDLGGHQKNEIYGGTRTFKQFADWLFAGTGWTYEAGDVTGSKLIPNYGNDNFLKLLEVLLSTYECERQILPGKRIRFAKKLGPDRDAQYRYGHNIKALSRSVDTTSLYTSIKGYGGNGLVVTYTSPNAAKFPHAGEQEPIRDERFTVAESLAERLRQELDDTPKVSIELDALELTQKELGERVWLIYEPLGIEFQTRILAKTTRIPAEKSSAVIGNSMPKSLTDALTDTNVKIDENDKQNQSKFEQTNEKITTEVERLDGDIVEAYSRIEQTADAIVLEVGNQITALDGKVTQNTSRIEQTANYITSTVDKQIRDLNGVTQSHSSSISQMADSITSIVSFSDVDGDDIISKVTQTASAFKIQAKNIELEGITTVASTLNLGSPNATGNKALVFSNYSAIETGASQSMEIASFGAIYLNGVEVFFRNMRGNPGDGAVIRFDSAKSINWGTHAPDVTARFG